MTTDQHINAIRDEIFRVCELLEVLNAIGEDDDVEMLGCTVNTRDFREIFHEAARKHIEQASNRLCDLEALLQQSGNIRPIGSAS